MGRKTDTPNREIVTNNPGAPAPSSVSVLPSIQDPNVAAQWDPPGNGLLSPPTIRSDSPEIVTWRCRCNNVLWTYRIDCEGHRPRPDHLQDIVWFAVSPIGTTFLSCITRIKFLGPRVGRAGSRSRMKGTLNPVRAPQ